MRMIDAEALAKAMGVYTYMQTEWTPATAWGVPIVDAEPVKHGFLIKCLNSYVCSECEAILPDIGYWLDYSYCPKCGAKLDEVEERLVMPKADGSTIPRDYAKR